MGAGDAAGQCTPAVGAPGRHGRLLLHSAASVGRGGCLLLSDSPTIFRDSVGPVPSDGQGGWATLVGAAV